MFNVGARGIAAPNAVIGMACFVGGLAQFAAGMWGTLIISALRHRAIYLPTCFGRVYDWQHFRRHWSVLFLDTPFQLTSAQFQIKPHFVDRSLSPIFRLPPHF